MGVYERMDFISRLIDSGRLPPTWTLSPTGNYGDKILVSEYDANGIIRAVAMIEPAYTVEATLIAIEYLVGEGR